MGRKFIVHQNDFSNGQISKDYTGGDTNTLYSSACEELDNISVNNGKSVSKRAGTIALPKPKGFYAGHVFGLAPEDTLADISFNGEAATTLLRDTSNQRFFSFDGKLFVLTNIGIFCELFGDGRYYLVNPFYDPKFGIFVNFSSYPSFFSVTERFISPVPGNDGFDEFTIAISDEDLQSLSIDIEGNLCIIRVKDKPPFFLYKPYDRSVRSISNLGTGYYLFTLHQLFYFENVTRPGNSDNLKYALPFSPVPKTSILSRGDFGVKKYKNLTRMFSVYRRESGSEEYEFSHLAMKFSNRPSGNPTFILQVGGQVFLIHPLLEANSFTVNTEDLNSIDLKDGDFLIKYEVYPLTSLSLLSNLTFLSRRYDALEENVKFSLLNDDYNLYICDWGPQFIDSRHSNTVDRYPEKFFLDKRFHVISKSNIWSSQIDRPFRMFYYESVVEGIKDIIPSAAKSRALTTLGSDSIVSIFRLNDFFILTNRNIYKKQDNIPLDTSSVDLVGSLSNLENANAVIQDSSFFHLNIFGELFRTVFNFSENSFNSINYSALITFNYEPRFKNIFYSERYPNTLFCLADDGKVYTLYFRNNEKIYAWSTLSFPEYITHISVLFDGTLLLRYDSGHVIYDHRANRIDDIFLDNYVSYASIDKFKEAVSASGGTFNKKLFINGLQFDYDPVNGQPTETVFENIKTIATGDIYSSTIKLMPISPPDNQGDGIDLYKKIKEVFVRGHQIKRLSCSVNSDISEQSIVTKNTLALDNSPKDYLRFEGFSWSSEDLRITFKHNWASYFKIIGATIKGMIK